MSTTTTATTTTTTTNFGLKAKRNDGIGDNIGSVERLHRRRQPQIDPVTCRPIVLQRPSRMSVKERSKMIKEFGIPLIRKPDSNSSLPTNENINDNGKEIVYDETNFSLPLSSQYNNISRYKASSFRHYRRSSRFPVFFFLLLFSSIYLFNMTILKI
jgi:hypothetical protein